MKLTEKTLKSTEIFSGRILHVYHDDVELPDGYLYFNPIVNWGKFREENGRLMMPVAIRLNHASADGFLAALFYKNLEKEISGLCEQ